MITFISLLNIRKYDGFMKKNVIQSKIMLININVEHIPTQRA